jgi:hypothetical protein
MLQKKQNIFLKNYLLTKNLMIKLLLREVEKLETLRLKEEYSVLLDEFIKRQQNEAQQNEAQQNEAQQNEAQQNEAQQNEAQQNEAQQNEAQQNEAQQNEAQQNEAQQNEAQQNEAQQNEAQQNEAQQNEAQQTFISEEDFINIELKKLNLKNLSKVDIFNSYPQIADKSLIISELENALDLTQADKESFLENQIQNEYLWGDFFSKISPLFNPYFVPKKNLSSFSILSIVKFKKKKKIKPWKFKKRKLRKLYSLKRVKRVLFFKRYRLRRFLNYFISSYFFFKKLSITSNTLVNRIPLTKKVINDSNLEIFYKLNKNLKEDLAQLVKNPNNLVNDDIDFHVYLRNYHQKPYWKFRGARILH